MDLLRRDLGVTHEYFCFISNTICRTRVAGFVEILSALGIHRQTHLDDVDVYLVIDSSRSKQCIALVRDRTYLLTVGGYLVDDLVLWILYI